MVASGIGAISRSMWLLSHNKFVFPNPKSNTRNTAYFPEKIRIPSNNNVLLQKFTTSFSTKAAAFSVGNTEYAEEPATNVKFQTSLNLPGCSSPLSLIGTGFREKKFAIIGVKVYAAGLYIDPAILDKLQAWKGKTASDIQDDSSLFDLVYQASLEKSLQIVLVRDVDGKTFWDAVDEAISPIMKSPTSVDEIALATFRGTFQGRSLKKGTLIFLTWVDPSKMLIHLSAEGIPSAAEATIESQNVTRSLFDIFFGRAPVSPTLKSSVCNALTSALKRTRLSVTQ